MNSIISAVREDLNMKNVAPSVLENVPSLIRRAIIALHKDGAIPSKLEEFKVIDKKEEKRDGSGNLIYNFFFLNDDFFRLDKFIVYNIDTEDNISERIYQRVSTDLLFTKRRPEDKRKFFSIADYNIGDERSRKILVLDPFPEDGEFVEVRYFVDGTKTSLENFNQRYWEPVITKVRQLVGITSRIEAEEEIIRESANWRSQEGKDAFNKTHVRTAINNGLYGKTP